MKSLSTASAQCLLARTVFPLWLGLGLALTSLPDARAQQTATLTNIYNFTGPDGSIPNTLIVGTDGNFYGTTANGGPNDSFYGTVFRLTPAGALTTLYAFTGGADGGIPVPGLIQANDGNFYGITSQNGSGREGTIYQVTPAGGFKVLYSFSNGEVKSGLVQGNDGNFYGVNPNGLIYQVTPAGGYTNLHFDGELVSGGLVRGADGNFYGTDDGTGITSRKGAFFQVTPTGTFTILGSFPATTDGPSASTLVQSSDGNFYGTTSYGGSNGPNATIFRFTPVGGYTLLHNFDPISEFTIESNSALVQGSDGNFYGATQVGGTNDEGTLFQITPTGVFTTLYNFTGGNDGAAPQATNDSGIPGSALIRGNDGSLYGTTAQGGYNSGGTIYKVTLHPGFFAGATALNRGVYYLALPNGNPFGYYSFLSDPNYLYHFDLGYEYVFDANDGQSGVYLYDFASSTFFYTSPTFPFPYLYDFSLNAVLYYFPDPNYPGRYNTNGTRFFYNFATGQIITK